jgi:hypothetical protein
MKLIGNILIGALWCVLILAALLVWAATDPHVVRTDPRHRKPARPARAGRPLSAVMNEVFARSHAENRVYQMRRAAPYN